MILIAIGLSSCPVTSWNRRLNSSSFASASFVSNSSSDRSRSSSGFVTSLALFPFHEPGLHRQLVSSQPHGFVCSLFVHAGQLEHDPPRLHDGDPALRAALARPH